jgi:predicted dehydrogenase
MSALPELRPAPSVPAADREGFLVAGSGSIGRRHLENLRRLGGTDATLYRTGRRDPAAPTVDAPEEPDLTRALAARPRAVLVCNPSALHLETALAAARSGAHLLVEKPLSHTLEGTDALAREVRSRGLVALVGFQYRFHPGLVRVKRWLEDGALGRVLSARVHWGEDLSGWHPGEDWRRGYAARRGPRRGSRADPVPPLRLPAVAARRGGGRHRHRVARGARARRGGPRARHGSLRVGGAVATVTLDYVQRPRTHGLEIVGTRGRACWSDEDGSAYLHDAARDCTTPFRPAPGFTRNDMFLDEMRHFLACLDGREEPACTIEDGRAAVEIADAALRSAEEGRRVAIGEGA